MHDHRQQKKLVFVGISLVVLAAVLVVGGVWLARHRGAAPVAGRTSVGPFHLGDEVHNRAHMKMKLDLGSGDAPQEIELEGEWTATVTDIHDGLAEVACQLSSLKASVRQQAAGGQSPAPLPEPQPEAERQMAGELMRRFFVSYRADGAVAGAWLPKAMNPSLSSMLLRLAGAGQLVRPAGAQAAWVVQERDINGEYTAVYQQTGPDRFTKQKGRYLRVDKKDDLPVEVKRSKCELRADARGRVLEVEQDEALAINVAAAGMSFQVTLEIALREARTGRAPALVGAFARERDKLERHLMEQMGFDAKADTVRRDRGLLAGASFSELQAALKALPAESGSSGDRARALGLRFEALFRLDREAAAMAPAMVRAETMDRGRLVVEALSMAATPEAQTALGAVAKDAGMAFALRRYAVQCLGLQKQPSTSGVVTLGLLLDDANAELRQAASLAYGTAARSLAAGAPERARPIVQELHRRLAAEKNEDVRADLIAAVGNAGDASSLPVLRPVIENGTQNARGRAIRALRFIVDPTVDPLLASLLQNKSSEHVRLSAIGTIRYRDVGPFTMALADIALADPVVTVRQAAIDLLGNRMRELPTLRTVLERAQKQDPSPNVRELAARHLGLQPT
jgi:HEAT repeat protein